MRDTNTPAIHQRHITITLLSLIGKICCIFIDDIIIWSCSIKEHKANIQQVLQTLWKAHLYCLPKKTDLFAIEIYFLEYVISNKDIQVDLSKIDKILDWPTPKYSLKVQRFLSLV